MHSLLWRKKGMMVLIIIALSASVFDHVRGDIRYCESEELGNYSDEANIHDCRLIDLYIISKSVICEEDAEEVDSSYSNSCSSGLLSTPTVISQSFFNNTAPARAPITGNPYSHSRSPHVSNQPQIYEDVLRTYNDLPTPTIDFHPNQQGSNFYAINDNLFRVMIKRGCKEQLSLQQSKLCSMIHLSKVDRKKIK